MLRIRLLKLFIDTCAGFFIFLWIYAASGKLMDYEFFLATLEKSPLIGKYAVIISWILPAIETGAAILLIIPAFRKRGFIISFLMMLLFTAYTVCINFFVPEMPCSCGGLLEQLNWKQHLWFNIILSVFVMSAIIANQRYHHLIAIHPGSRGHGQPAGIAENLL